MSATVSYSFKDFQPTAWTVITDGEKYPGTEIPQWIRNDRTGKIYLNEKESTIRVNCAAFVVGTPILHALYAISLVAEIGAQIIRRFAISTAPLKVKLLNTGNELLRVALLPIAIVGLTLAATIGVFNPRYGRQLYGSIESVIYKTGKAAPCFRPNATSAGIDGDAKVSYSFKDFQPSGWTVVSDGDKYEGIEIPKWIRNDVTGKKYLNEKESTIRAKCAVFVIGTPVLHALYSISLVAETGAQIIRRFAIAKAPLKVKLLNTGKELLRVALLPIAIVGLTLAAAIGVFNPRYGRQLYGSIEGVIYKMGKAAPCFAPNARAHGAGGPIGRRGAW
ncbi:MAG: hypothetical protein JSR76_03615 [Verrucomicrobia bacterium]|nr:hypothetical protein [Verrucomicrobiota bacterium]